MNSLFIRLTAFFLFLITTPVLAQNDEEPEEELRRVRIAAQVGFPSLLGLNAEVVLPALGNRLTATADFGYLPVNYEENLSTFKYFSAGANLYVRNKAKGFYVGADYGLMPISAKPASSNTTYSTSFSFFNTKAGLKLGEKLYFNIEFGYSIIFYGIDSANEFLDEVYGIQIRPELDFLQLMNGKIGLGYSF